MNKEEAKKYLPLIQEFAEGKTIQYLNSAGEWADLETTDWNSNMLYRVKPKSAYRPWEFKEVKIGYLIKKKDESFPYNVGLITGVDLQLKNPVLISLSWSTTTKDLLLNFLYSPDQGQTWLPCGTKI